MTGRAYYVHAVKARQAPADGLETATIEKLDLRGKQTGGLRSAILDGVEIFDPSGSLSVFSVGENLPFAAARLFMIHSVPQGGLRCNHAHREQSQLIVSLGGRIQFDIEERSGVFSDVLSTPQQAVYLAPLSWLRMRFLDETATAVVLSSGLYDEAEYIRDYEEFQSIINET